MNWIDVNEKLPPSPTRVLARCVRLYKTMDNFADLASWVGVVDVFFDAQIGWITCDNQTTLPKDFRITHYTDHPFPNHPWEIKKDNQE